MACTGQPARTGPALGPRMRGGTRGTSVSPMHGFADRDPLPSIAYEFVTETLQLEKNFMKPQSGQSSFSIKRELIARFRLRTLKPCLASTAGHAI